MSTVVVPTTADGRATYTVAEAARLLGISRVQGYRLVRRGELPALHLGRSVLIPAAHVRRMLGITDGEGA